MYMCTQTHTQMHSHSTYTHRVMLSPSTEVNYSSNINFNTVINMFCLSNFMHTPRSYRKEGKIAPYTSFNFMTKIFTIFKSQHYYLIVLIYQSCKHAVLVVQAFHCIKLFFDLKQFHHLLIPAFIISNLLLYSLGPLSIVIFCCHPSPLSGSYHTLKLT